MSSEIRATSIEAEELTVTNVISRPYRPGEIIEYLSRPCDGGVLTGEKGDFVIQDVTAVQTFGDSYALVDGSQVSYQPPDGAQSVIYRYVYQYGYVDNDNITHFKLLLDGTEVLYARETVRHDINGQLRQMFEWAFRIGEADDPNTGSVLTWNSPKTIERQVRRYSSSYDGKVNAVNHWDGGGSSDLVKPIITIIATG